MPSPPRPVQYSTITSPTCSLQYHHLPDLFTTVPSPPRSVQYSTITSLTCSLQYHHLPDLFTTVPSPPRLVHTAIQQYLSRCSYNSDVEQEMDKFHRSQQGIVTRDPCSPLLFNLCFNLLMQVLDKPEFKNLGYSIWGPKQSTYESSWLQFADDAAIISNSTKGTQQLLNICVAWCEWSQMTIRLDKRITFGMAKLDNTFSQYQPALFITNENIHAVTSGESFVYLGKIFDFVMRNKEAKNEVSEKN